MRLVETSGISEQFREDYLLEIQVCNQVLVERRGREGERQRGEGGRQRKRRATEEGAHFHLPSRPVDRLTQYLQQVS